MFVVWSIAMEEKSQAQEISPNVVEFYFDSNIGIAFVGDLLMPFSRASLLGGVRRVSESGLSSS